jgi:hypothetical protein
MMKRLFLLLFCMNLLPFYILAQPTKAPARRWQPGLIAEAGLLAGAQKPGLDARALFSLRRQRLTLAAGGGIDWYRYRSVPLLLQGRYHFGKGHWRPFVQLSAGLNLVAPSEGQRRYSWQPVAPPEGRIGISWPFQAVAHSYQHGYYADAGVGYTLYNKRGRGLALSLAWQRKTLGESWPDWQWAGGQLVQHRQQLRWTLDRVALRVGWQF